MEAVYQQKDGVMTADMNGETVMMDINTGKYYNLGRVGSEIWALLKNPLSEQELIDELLARYKVNPEQCRKETAAFVQKLLSIGLIGKCEQEKT